MTTQLFPLGHLVTTPGVGEYSCRSEAHAARVLGALRRHREGDWGDVPPEDKIANDRSLADGSRLVSAYDVETEPAFRIWIITESDRSSTCLLLPEEY